MIQPKVVVEAGAGRDVANRVSTRVFENCSSHVVSSTSWMRTSYIRYSTQ